CVSQQNTFLPTHQTLPQNHKHNPNHPKQITFPLTQSQYLNFKHSPQTLNITLPSFLNKNPHPSPFLPPKLHKTTPQSIPKHLTNLPPNPNHIPKYSNQHQHQIPNYIPLHQNLTQIPQTLHHISQQLNYLIPNPQLHQSITHKTHHNKKVP
uniref:hypothetical protein n=1 Tax=Staphylococcus epidermidis TaxID=1282 RepID=UPI001C931C17